MAIKTPPKRHYLPPVIPEIAQAYKNDPKTAMALAAIKSGQSTDPVAKGGYGYADGIARALQGALGGYAAGRQNDVYGKEEADAVAAQNQYGMSKGGAIQALKIDPQNAEQLAAVNQARDAARAPVDPGTPPPPAPAPGVTPSGVGTAIPPPVRSGMAQPIAPDAAPPPGVTPSGVGTAIPTISAPPISTQAGSAIATAMGVPPAASAPPAGLPGIPMAPIPSAATPVMGGGPNGRLPLPRAAAPAAAAASVASDPYHFTPQAVPDAPPPVERPKAPEAVAATRSPLLDRAYELMSHSTRYDYTRAQELETQGLAEQGKYNESYTERKQKILDDMSATDRAVYAHASESDRDAIIARAAAAEQHNFQGGQDALNRTATRAEGSANRANAIKLEQMRAAAAIEAAKVRAETGDISGDPETLNLMAKQALAGDTSVYQGIGRGPNGARNTIALRREMYREGATQGLGPVDVANMNLEFFGKKAEARAIGGRVGATGVAISEVPPLAVEAVATHKALKQGDIVPFNRALQMYQNNTSSPALAKAVIANQALANAYGRSWGTGGNLSVSARKEAQDKLAVAWGTPGYDAAVQQVLHSIKAERAGAQGALSDIGNANRARGDAAVPQRKPGETPAQYIARTGG